MVTRGIIRNVDDQDGFQRVQVDFHLAGLRDHLIRLQGYGMTAVPLSGAAALGIGERESMIVSHVDDPRYRPTGLKSGEVCLYTHEGDRLHFANGRQAKLKTQRLEVEAETLKLGKTVDFVAVVRDLIDALTRATAGRDPLVCPELPVLKTKVETLIGSSNG